MRDASGRDCNIQRLRLFRGISVDVSIVPQTILEIKNQGLTPAKGRWPMEYYHPGALDVLFNNVNLSTADTRPENRHRQPAVCACGEEIGALYYAWRHNRTGELSTPIIVEFVADLASVAVDGRDFLYTAFQFADPPLARAPLAKSFGEASLRYAEAAWASEEQSRRIAMCDLAIHDPAVVMAHYNNDVILGGRHRTEFRSAFIVRLPIDSTAIIRVWTPTKKPKFPTPQIVLPSILSQTQRSL
jgi:hypothetical protein